LIRIRRFYRSAYSVHFFPSPEGSDITNLATNSLSSYNFSTRHWDLLFPHFLFSKGSEFTHYLLFSVEAPLSLNAQCMFFALSSRRPGIKLITFEWTIFALTKLPNWSISRSFAEVHAVRRGPSKAGTDSPPTDLLLELTAIPPLNLYHWSRFAFSFICPYSPPSFRPWSHPALSRSKLLPPRNALKILFNFPSQLFFLSAPHFLQPLVKYIKRTLPSN